MATHFLPLSKNVSCTYLHPKTNICAKFHENRSKTEEVVRDGRFSPIFGHNMPLPWQHTFCHCRKMCLAHLHPKTNICAKFHENRSKTEEVVRDARLRPTDTLIPIQCVPIKRKPRYRHARLKHFIIKRFSLLSFDTST